MTLQLEGSRFTPFSFFHILFYLVAGTLSLKFLCKFVNKMPYEALWYLSTQGVRLVRIDPSYLRTDVQADFCLTVCRNRYENPISVRLRQS
jgi:hypothetical protein